MEKQQKGLLIRGTYEGKQNFQTKNGKVYSKIAVRTGAFDIYAIGVSADYQTNHKQGDLVELPVRASVYRDEISYFVIDEVANF